MKKYTQKALREMAKNSLAVDITNAHDYKAIPEKYERVGYSRGIYGCNGKLFKGESGCYYVVTKATSALYMF